MRKINLAALALLAFLFVASCGGGGGGGGDAESMRISGNLYTGLVDPVAPSKGAPVKATPISPLPGYKVACATFSATPLSGAGTAGDDGWFEFELETGSASFGCFVLNANDEAIATLVFTNGANTESGQTLSATGSVHLGDISVATANGIAQATVPDGASLVTSAAAGAACPGGTWIVTSDLGHSPSCEVGKDITSTVWIVEEPSGDHYASFTAYNVGIDDVCSVGSKSGLQVQLLEDGSAEFSFLYQFESPPDPSMTATITVTPSADCTVGTAHQVVTGCASCDPCTSGGDLTCESDFDVERL